jgi:predicted MFS family arabinose efflux permease
MVPPDDVQNAVSMNSAIMTGARVFGPALAGLLSATVGYGWCFTLDGLSYIAVIVALWKINSAELRPAPVTERRKGQVREGLRYAHSQPDLWIPLVMMAAIGLLAFNFQVVMPLFVTRSLGGGDGMYTILYSVLSIGSLLGALATARRATVEVSNVITGAVVFGVSMVLLAFMPTLLLAFPAGLLMGFASMVFMTQSTAIVQVRSDPTMRGRVLALQAIVFLGSTPIGGPVLGWICDAWGARAGLLVGGVSCFLAVAWGAYALRRMEERKALELSLST